MDNTNRDTVEDSEVQNLFYLIDVDKKGIITAQDARIAKELIRERFCIDEVGVSLADKSSSCSSNHHQNIIFINNNFRVSLALNR